MTSIEKKKSFIINTVYVAFIIALFYLFMKYAFGLFLPFLCAVAVAKLLQRPLNFICKKTPIKRGFAATVLVLLALVVFSSLFVVIIARFAVEVKGFFQYLMIQLEDIPSLIEKITHWLQNGIAFLPDSIESSVTAFVSDKLSILLNSPDAPQGGQTSMDFSWLYSPMTSVWNTAKEIPSKLIAVVMAIVCCCFMTADYTSLRNIFLSLFHKDTREKVIRSKKLLFPALGKMAKAYGIIIAITFSELSLGLFLLKILGIYSGGYILIISFFTAIIDVVPILGTGTILVPWALYNLLIGNYPMAIGIVIIYVCITIIRQIIEPKLVAGQLGLPAFATLIAMFVGTQIFGFIGIFLLPITVVMIKLLNDEGIIHVFHKDVDKPDSEEKTDVKSPEKECSND